MAEPAEDRSEDKQRTRFVSRITPDTLAVVLAGGRGSRLGVLTEWRTKPAVPFGGKFRIIDFTLSNCVNSGIHRISVLTQYRSHSLMQHVTRGWGFLNAEIEGFLDVVPAQQWVDEETWYQGTADAVYQSRDILEGYGPEFILILAGDHIYNMDYGEMLGEHVNSGADFTVACNRVPLAEATEFGVMEVNESGRIVGFEEKPRNPKPVPGNPDAALISMGIYVATRGFLFRELERDAADAASEHDFGKNIIPRLLGAGARVQSHRFHSPVGSPRYWRDVGTVDAYFRSNLELLAPEPPLNLDDAHWPVRTFQPQLPPARIISDSGGCELHRTLLSGGCTIEESRIEESILFSDVKVGRDCELQRVLALPGCEIGAGCRLRDVILDNQCQLSDGSEIGFDKAGDWRRFRVSDGGVTVVNRKMLGQEERYLPGLFSRL